MMFRSTYMLIGIALLASSHAAAATPRTMLAPGAHYEAMRQKLSESTEPWMIKTRDRLKRDAERALEQGPWSVMDKSDDSIAPSGDKHDFVSFSEYWWRNEDGSWDYRDGQRNPAMSASDITGLYKLYSNIQVLGTAGYLFNEPKYHEHAAKILRTWFLDPATRMNPNLNFASGIQGKAEGRSFGLHRMKKMPEIFDMIALMRETGAWTDADEQAMQQWTRVYLDWATTSEFGLAERVAKNNHSVYYAYHAIGCALYVGDTTLISDLLGEHFRTTLLGQITSDGTMPIELRRTKPMGYTVYNLTAFLMLAEVARSAGVDLYTVKGEEGQSIDTAIATTLAYLRGERVWPEAKEPALKLYDLLPAMRFSARRLHNDTPELYLRSLFSDWEKDYHNLWWPPE